MKEIVIISGKGGTGKTCLTAAFASLSRNAVFCDADVDAADLHLILLPEIREKQEFIGGHKAVINHDKCTECGLCQQVCRFSAISEGFYADSVGCEGCGVCVWACPEKAIEFPEQVCGEWFVSKTRFGTMVHARLGIAEENSGKLVTMIRKKAAAIAEETHCDLILTDGPPGIGCPVIASVGGASAVVIVSEPTLSGLHDADRVIRLAAHFRVPAMLCVNKADLNPNMAEQIGQYAVEHGVKFLGNIPFDPIFTQAMIQQQSIFEYGEDSDTKAIVKEIWQSVVKMLM